MLIWAPSLHFSSPASTSRHLLVDEVTPFGCGTKGLEVLKEGGTAVGGRQGRQPRLQPQWPVGTVQQRPHQWHQPRAALHTGGSCSWGLPVFGGQLTGGGVKRPCQRGLQLGQHIAGLLPAHGHRSLQQRVQLHIGLGVQLGAKGKCGRHPATPRAPYTCHTPLPTPTVCSPVGPPTGCSQAQGASQSEPSLGDPLCHWPGVTRLLGDPAGCTHLQRAATQYIPSSHHQMRPGAHGEGAR